MILLQRVAQTKKTRKDKATIENDPATKTVEAPVIILDAAAEIVVLTNTVDPSATAAAIVVDKTLLILPLIQLLSPQSQLTLLMPLLVRRVPTPTLLHLRR